MELEKRAKAKADRKILRAKRNKNNATTANVTSRLTQPKKYPVPAPRSSLEFGPPIPKPINTVRKEKHLSPTKTSKVRRAKALPEKQPEVAIRPKQTVAYVFGQRMVTEELPTGI